MIIDNKKSRGIDGNLAPSLSSPLNTETVEPGNDSDWFISTVLV